MPPDKTPILLAEDLIIVLLDTNTHTHDLAVMVRQSREANAEVS